MKSTEITFYLKECSLEVDAGGCDESNTPDDRHYYDKIKCVEFNVQDVVAMPTTTEETRANVMILASNLYWADLTAKCNSLKFMLLKNIQNEKEVTF